LQLRKIFKLRQNNSGLMAENSFIKILKYYILKLKSFFFSKDVLSFLIFLALSASFWFVNALDKERETSITIPLRYVGIPQNISIINKPPTEISLIVKDEGLRLFSYSKSNLTPLTIDLSRVFYEKGDILITRDQLSGKISRYMRPTTTVLEVRPDSILIQYEKLNVSVLPIELVSNIELTHQYILSDKIQFDPTHITVFGPKRILDTLKTIRTEFVELKNINDTTIFRCKFKPIKSVRFSSKDTKVSVFVEMFTEKKVQIPITFSNCPRNLSIRTFPALVNVTYNVGLSHFNMFKSTDIQVMLDYNELKSGKHSKQKLKIINNTSHISNLRISPEEVEFLLEEK